MSEDWRSQSENNVVGSPARPQVVKPERRRHWKRWVVLVLGLIVVALIGFAVMLSQNVAKMSTNPWYFGVLANDSARTNVLVLGSGDPGHAGEKLTDTIMILSSGQQTQHNGIAGLPRDMRVPIAGFGSGKINSAYALGGLDTARQTVANVSNQPIHYAIELKFNGVVTLVDALGGLDVDVKERLYDTEYPCVDNQYKACGLDIPAGLQHMDGQTALAYMRCRKGTCGNDFGRVERQQEVVGLISERVTDLNIWLHPSTLWRLSLTADDILITDMSVFQMLQFAWQWQKYNNQSPANHLVLSTESGGLLQNGGGSDLVPIGGNWQAIHEAIARLVDRP